jgi:hypothetical protein
MVLCAGKWMNGLCLKLHGCTPGWWGPVQSQSLTSLHHPYSLSHYYYYYYCCCCCCFFFFKFSVHIRPNLTVYDTCKIRCDVSILLEVEDLPFTFWTISIRMKVFTEHKLHLLWWTSMTLQMNGKDKDYTFVLVCLTAGFQH